MNPIKKVWIMSTRGGHVLLVSEFPYVCFLCHMLAWGEAATLVALYWRRRWLPVHLVELNGKRLQNNPVPQPKDKCLLFVCICVCVCVCLCLSPVCPRPPAERPGRDCKMSLMMTLWKVVVTVGWTEEEVVWTVEDKEIPFLNQLFYKD